MISMPKLLLLLVVVLVLFGASRLPALGSGLGEGIRNFRNSLKEGSGKKNSSNT